jgi:DNA-directed RNA polymerase specialized sigma24 family protein
MKSSFPQTQWTSLIDVIQREPADSALRRAALGDLYAQYREPVSSYINRVFYRTHFPGASPDDLTNDFFKHLIEHDALAGVSRDKGRFRSWMKRCLVNFCNSYLSAAYSIKSGGRVTIPLQWDEAHEVELEDIVLAEAGRIFDRAYARRLHPLVLDELCAEYHARGQGSLCNDLRAFILSDSENDYERVAARHAMKYEAVATAVNRLRKRYGMKLKHKIAESLVSPTPAELEEEVRYLIWLLRDGPDELAC